MMIKLKYIIIAAIGLLFTISSCSKDGDEITRTLKLDKSSLLFTKEIHVETIKVTVDEGVKFSTEWKGGDWGVAEPNVQEGTITVTVQRNPTSTLRKASLVVTTQDGLRNSVVDITQNGDNPLLDVIPDEVLFDFMGGEQILKVTSDIAWNVTSDTNIDWVEFRSQVNAGEIIIKVDHNTNYQPRTTTFIVSAGANLKEVAINQEETQLFIFPYLDMSDATFEELLAFEEARHNTVTEGNGRMVPTAAYTHSPLMPIILYDNMTMASDGRANPSIKINDTYMPDFFSDGITEGKIHAMALEYGFEHIVKRTSDNIDYYWLDYGADAEYHCMLTIIPRVKLVIFDGEKEKPVVDAPTFDAFPYPPAEIPWDSEQTIAETWESANGGTLFEKDPETLIYLVNGSKLYKARYYNYYMDKLDRIDYLIVELSMIYLLMPDYTYLINPKFEALLAKEGFVFVRSQRETLVYENTAKELELIIGAAHSPEGEEIDETKYGAISFIHVPAGSGISKSATGFLNTSLKLVP